MLNRIIDSLLGLKNLAVLERTESPSTTVGTDDGGQRTCAVGEDRYHRTTATTACCCMTSQLLVTASSTAGAVVTSLVVTPLDMVKTRLQVQSAALAATPDVGKRCESA